MGSMCCWRCRIRRLVISGEFFVWYPSFLQSLRLFIKVWGIKNILLSITPQIIRNHWSEEKEHEFYTNFTLQSIILNHFHFISNRKWYCKTLFIRNQDKINKINTFRYLFLCNECCTITNKEPVQILLFTVESFMLGARNTFTDKQRLFRKSLGTIPFRRTTIDKANTTQLLSRRNSLAKPVRKEKLTN